MADPAYTLTPVSHDPFGTIDPSAFSGVTLTPVSHDPFAKIPLMSSEPPTFANSPFASSGTLRPYEPSAADRLRVDTSQDLQAAGFPRDWSEDMGQKLVNVVGMSPLGAGMATDEAERAVERGDYPSAALNAGGATLAIFAGPGAKTADLVALDVAKSMMAKGADRQAVWDATKWFQGADGKWRFEIPDQTEMRLKSPLPDAGETAWVDKTFSSPLVSQAYPDMFGGTEIQRGIAAKGMFQPGDVLPNGEGVLSPHTLTVGPGATRSTLLHEVQHGVQNEEGFARGANQFGLRPGTPAWDIYQERLTAMGTPPDYVEDNWGATPEEAKKNYGDYVAQQQKWVRNGFPLVADRAAQDYAVREAYRRSAGEVEARNTQARMHMTPAERAATPPWETQDVPNEKQIVLQRVKGDPFSLDASVEDAPEPPTIIAYHGSPHSFDKFDMSKIGTGEGNHSFGHGLYTAENEDVARGYRDRLSQGIAFEKNGQPVMYGDFTNEMRQAIQNAGKIHPDQQEQVIKQITDMMENGKSARYIEKNFYAPVGFEEPWNAALNVAKSYKYNKTPGSMYQVSIAANPDHFLDWDKPLSEHPQQVIDALGKYDPAIPQAIASNPKMTSQTLQDMYGLKSGEAGAKFAQTMNDAGVPGIKYRDAGSRTVLPDEELVRRAADIDRQLANANKTIVGMPDTMKSDYQGHIDALTKERAAIQKKMEPSRNYVVFSADNLKILKKYGIAGLMGTAGLTAGAHIALTPVDGNPFEGRSQ